MRGISKETITEKVKDVIYETGLLRPREAITINQRFKEDYGLAGKGPIAAFTSRVNAQFRPYGKSVSRDAMAKCVRVSNLISKLGGGKAVLIRKPIQLLKEFSIKQSRKTAGKGKVSS